MSDRQKAIDALLGPGDAWDDDQILGACYAVDKAFAAVGITFDADGNIPTTRLVLYEGSDNRQFLAPGDYIPKLTIGYDYHAVLLIRKADSWHRP